MGATSTTSSTTSTPKTCPESKDSWDWVPFDGNCYKLVDAPLEWLEAQRYCREDGDLLSIHSEEENDFVGQMLLTSTSGHSSFFIGLKSINSRKCGANIIEDRENWEWSDGSSWNYTHWLPDRPYCNSHNDYWFVYFQLDTDFGFRWNNYHCSFNNCEFPFVCKTQQLK